MTVAHARQRRVARPTVRPHHGPGVDVRADEITQRARRGVGDNLEPNRPEPLPRTSTAATTNALSSRTRPSLRRRCMPRPPRPRCGAARGRAEPSPAGVSGASPTPSHSGRSQLALELEGRQARGVRRHEIGRPKPFLQGRARSMQHGPGGDRRVVPARHASPEEAFIGVPRRAGPAGGSFVSPSTAHGTSEALALRCGARADHTQCFAGQPPRPFGRVDRS
jgi:hypothetical protein